MTSKMTVGVIVADAATVSDDAVDESRKFEAHGDAAVDREEACSMKAKKLLNILDSYF